MEAMTDPILEPLFGSRTRLLTMAVLANADEPLTGYRVALLAGLPRQKVYPEIRRGMRSGLVQRTRSGFVLTDSDIRSLLRKRLRIRWDEEWDRARRGWASETPRLLSQGLVRIRDRVRSDPNYLRPMGWKPSRAAWKWIREMDRPPEKDMVLRRSNLRSSKREDWDTER